MKALYFIPQVLKNQYLSPQSLQRFQEKRLTHMLEHAYKHTQFYKKKFNEAGISPHDICSLHDLAKIPVTVKEEIVANPQQIIASGYSEENCEVHYTSGTSGKTLKVLYDIESHSYETAVTYRYHLGQGVRPWHKYLLILHDPLELEDAQRKSPFYRRKGISGALPVEEKVRIARSYQPYVVGGHLSTFVAMAQHIEHHHIDHVNPRIIIVGGELNPPSFRRYVEKIFQGQTFDKYGAFEVKSIAWECTHHHLHMDADSVLVEFVKDGEPVAPGERGEVVVTTLQNKAMPFIRYNLRDIGIPSDDVCPCGRTLPLMKIIEGRSDDFLVLPSGRALPPTALVPYFFRCAEVDQFKILQHRKDVVIIKIVPKKGFTEKVEKTLVQEVKTALGEPVCVQIEKVNTIEEESATKFRTVVSTVDMDLSSL